MSAHSLGCNEYLYASSTHNSLALFVTESQFVFYLFFLNKFREDKMLFIFFIAKYLEQIIQLRVTGN